MRRILLYLFVSLSLCLTVSCEIKRDDAARQNMAVTTTNVNLRSGPSTKDAVIRALEPSTIVEINFTDSVNPEWINVTTARGETGFIAVKYAEMLPPAVDNVSEETIRLSERNFFTIYPLFVVEHPGYGLIVLLTLFIVQYIWCSKLKKKYNYELETKVDILTMRRNNSLTTIVWSIIVSGALTLYQMVGIFMIRKEPSADDVLFTLMLLSTGFLMASMPWRINLSGLINIADRRINPRVIWGRRMGTVLWVVLLAPIAYFIWQLSDWFQISPGSDSFLNLILNALVYLIFGVIVAAIWVNVIAKNCLRSMGSSVLWAFTAVIFIGIGKVGYVFCDSTYTFLTFGISVVVLVALTISTFVYANTMIVENRCTYCHSFGGKQVGTTDLGSSWETTSHWQPTDSSGVTRKHRDSEISDVKVRVEERYRTDRWKTHHVCRFCMNTWDINHSEESLESSRITDQRWKETYYD